MNKSPTIPEITRERLRLWAKKLDKENATPFALIAVSHGEKRGQMVVCTTEDTSNEQAALFLEGAARALRSQSEK